MDGEGHESGGEGEVDGAPAVAEVVDGDGAFWGGVRVDEEGAIGEGLKACHAEEDGFVSGDASDDVGAFVRGHGGAIAGVFLGEVWEGFAEPEVSFEDIPCEGRLVVLPEGFGEFGAFAGVCACAGPIGVIEFVVEGILGGDGADAIAGEEASVLEVLEEGVLDVGGCGIEAEGIEGLDGVDVFVVGGVDGAEPASGGVPEGGLDGGADSGRFGVPSGGIVWEVGGGGEVGEAVVAPSAFGIGGGDEVFVAAGAHFEEVVLLAVVFEVELFGEASFVGKEDAQEFGEEGEVEMSVEVEGPSEAYDAKDAIGIGAPTDAGAGEGHCDVRIESASEHGAEDVVCFGSEEEGPEGGAIACDIPGVGAEGAAIDAAGGEEGLSGEVWVIPEADEAAHEGGEAVAFEAWDGGVDGGEVLGGEVEGGVPCGEGFGVPRGEVWGGWGRDGGRSKEDGDARFDGFLRGEGRGCGRVLEEVSGDGFEAFWVRWGEVPFFEGDDGGVARGEGPAEFEVDGARGTIGDAEVLEESGALDEGEEGGFDGEGGEAVWGAMVVRAGALDMVWVPVVTGEEEADIAFAEACLIGDGVLIGEEGEGEGGAWGGVGRGEEAGDASDGAAGGGGGAIATAGPDVVFGGGGGAEVEVKEVRGKHGLGEGEFELGPCAAWEGEGAVGGGDGREGGGAEEVGEGLGGGGGSKEADGPRAWSEVGEGDEGGGGAIGVGGVEVGAAEEEVAGLSDGEGVEGDEDEGEVGGIA